MRVGQVAAGISVLVLAGLGCGRASSPANRPGPAFAPARDLGAIAIHPASQWEEERPDDGTRAAQWSVPAQGGDPEDAQVVVYYFGPEGRGDVAAHLDRWCGWFAQPDGRNSREVAEVEALRRDGLVATIVAVSGRYVAPREPGSPERFDQPGFRLLGAVVESRSGPYYFELLGPEGTVRAHERAFRTMIANVERAAGVADRSPP